MSDQKIELSDLEKCELRSARLNAEARGAEYRESLRVVEGLRLQREHLNLLLLRNEESLARETAAAPQRQVAAQEADGAYTAKRREVASAHLPAGPAVAGTVDEMFEDGSMRSVEAGN